MYQGTGYFFACVQMNARYNPPIENREETRRWNPAKRNLSGPVDEVLAYSRRCRSDLVRLGLDRLQP